MKNNVRGVKNSSNLNGSYNGVSLAADKKKLYLMVGVVAAILGLIIILFVSLQGPLAGKAYGAGIAVTQLNECTTITAPGIYEVRDISLAGADLTSRTFGGRACIYVTADDVTVSCLGVISGLGFDINNLNAGPVITAIEVNNVQTEDNGGVKITGCEISDFVNGIIIRDSVGSQSGIIIEENILSNVFTGINLVGSDNILVDSNVIGLVFADDTFGISATSGSTENIISQNTVVGSYTGISLVDSRGNYLIRNIVRDSTLVGLTGQDGNHLIENDIEEVVGGIIICSSSNRGACTNGLECVAAGGRFDSGTGRCGEPLPVGDNNILSHGDSCTVGDNCGVGRTCRNGQCLLVAATVGRSGVCAHDSECVTGFECEDSTTRLSVCVALPVEICTDGQDNDGDSRVDCRDTNCIGANSCQNLVSGRSCVDDSMCASNECDLSTFSCSPSSPGFESICNNNRDDDTDGRQDCRDTDCAGNSACSNLGIGSVCATSAMCASGNCDASTFTCAEAGDTTRLLGDVNGNGEITPFDSLLIKRHLVGLIILPPEQLQRADVNDCQSDSGVTPFDALLIERLIVGLIENLPCS